MRTPSTENLRRTIRSAALAALILFLACGEDGDHYAPLGTDEATQATVVAGVVRDAGKNAVTDALVVIEPASEGVAASAEWLAKNPGAASETTPGRRVTTTNARGRFAFERVDAGDYFLQVIADDHLGAMHSVRVPDRTAFVDTVYADVNLTPTGTFSGVATLENATAHQGTVVYVQGTSYVAVTDPAGAYAMTNVPVGSYTVRAEHAHYLEDTEGGTITTAGENVALASMLLKIDSNIPPVATIASATPEIENVPVQFVASGTDADGTVVLYEWDWEDDGVFDYSNPSSGNASHTYASGNYTAKLRVTDDDGAIGLAAVQLAIDSNSSPTATIVSASPQQDGVPVNFIANGSDVDGTIALYQWDWENDGTFDYSSAISGNASHLYAPGTYTARFRVTDDDGAINDDTVSVTIVALYVYLSSTHGNDSNPGTAALPVRTLPRAYVVAQASFFNQILAEEGDYFEAPSFLGGIDVLGGRVWPTFAEGASHSTFSMASTARATANGIITPTVIRRIAIQTSTPSGFVNSIALYASNSTAPLRFEECRFIASNGGPGSAGTTPAPSQNGLVGENGGLGSCNNNLPGAPGGPGGGSPTCAGGDGGRGGNYGSDTGLAGMQGQCGGGSGGPGGAGGDPGNDGINGSPGASGTSGTAGIPGSPNGSVAGGEWTPLTSTTGLAGTNGRGGGGGGGGGGQGCTFCDDGNGNGGGGGGGGGTGGGAGSGGQGGHASFAVMLYNASPTFISCFFQAGNGGNGGAGGAGRAGGTGAVGGLGGTACSSEIGEGGDGGAGGNGGSGPGGPGGPGGPSYCIYRAGSTPTIIAPTYTTGIGGAGGAGGANGFSGNAAAGFSGNSGTVN